MDHVWGTFLYGAFAGTTNHSEIVWFKTTTICLTHSSADWMGEAGLIHVCGQLLVCWEALLLRFGWLLAEAVGGDQAMGFSLSSRPGSHGGLAGPKKKSAMFLKAWAWNWHNVTSPHSLGPSKSWRQLKLKRLRNRNLMGGLKNDLANRCGFRERNIFGATFANNLPSPPSASVSRQSPPYWNVSYILQFAQKISSSSWRVRSVQASTEQIGCSSGFIPSVFS